MQMNQTMEILKKGLLICLAGCCIGVGVGIILYADICGGTVIILHACMPLILSSCYGYSSRTYIFVLIVAVLLLTSKIFGVRAII